MKEFIAVLAIWVGVVLYASGVLLFADQPKKPADPFPGFVACTVENLPFGEDVPPPRPIKGKSFAGHTFQWLINTETGEYLYRDVTGTKK